MPSKYEPPVKVFQQNQGFVKDRPLTGLALALAPRVEVVGILEDTEYSGVGLDGGKYFEVRLKYPWNNDAKPYEVRNGYGKDEMEVFIYVRGWLEKQGYRLMEKLD